MTFDYSRDRISSLIPGVWDSSEVLEATNPYAPDPEMPKSTPDPRAASTRTAECADIQQAWAGASLSRSHRASVVIVEGMGGSVADVARHLSISYAEAAVIHDTAIGNIGTFLNGKPFPDYKQKDSEKGNHYD